MFHNKSATGKVYRAMEKHGGYFTVKMLGQRVPGVKRTTLSVALKSLESRGLIVASPFVSYTGKRGKPMKAYTVIKGEE